MRPDTEDVVEDDGAVTPEDATPAETAEDDATDDSADATEPADTSDPADATDDETDDLADATDDATYDLADDSDDEDEDDGTDPDAPTAEDAPRRPGLLIAVLSLVLVALVVVTVVSGIRWRSSVQRDHREEAALAAGRTATAALLSYDYRTLDTDIARARAGLTTAYAKQYDQAAGALKTGAQTNQASVKAVVRTASVVTSTDDQASLLMYVDQTRSGKQVQNGGTVVDQSAIRVTVTKQGGRWLLSDLTPLG